VDAEVEDCNLDTYIHYLRKRLSYVGSTLALKTIRGVGYTLASS
jgi:DNA-binding response OmpR family regulator